MFIMNTAYPILTIVNMRSIHKMNTSVFTMNTGSIAMSIKTPSKVVHDTTELAVAKLAPGVRSVEFFYFMVRFDIGATETQGRAILTNGRGICWVTWHSNLQKVEKRVKNFQKAMNTGVFRETLCRGCASAGHEHEFV